MGVFTASEAFRSERVVGLSLSIPLRGTYRARSALEAEQQAEVARAGVDRETREIEVEVAAQVAEADLQTLLLVRRQSVAP